ncbi:ACP S-malonyltransferase [Cellulosilyticum ruminicola]|uniref:ACP S-malonyltransferase n=1 Tax=Cellulosilyticum ruminicola TaxID=425254 RepID=UPI0006D09074|nr:ACP S-malonyltransferase [Cellulosilyticum ruminicola]
MNKVTIIFPGQASQYVGMGKKYYDKYESVRERFEEASEILGFDLAKLCFEGPTKDLVQTQNAQVAIFVLSFAMFEVIQKEENVQADYLAGHSLGELSALAASGAFSFKDGVRIVYTRGQAMAKCTQGGMSAVTKLSVDYVLNLLKEIDLESMNVEIANYNAPYQTVLTGSKEGLKEVGEYLTKSGAKVVSLNVSGAFHSKYMLGAAEELSKVLNEVEIKEMKIPVMCGLEGRLYTNDDDIREALIKQLTGPVHWSTVVQKLDELGTKLWIEVGPKDVLKKLINRNIEQVEAYAYEKEEDLEGIQKALARIEEVKKQMPNLIGLCLGAAVATRNTNWDEQAYTEGVVKPYKSITSIFDQVAKEDRKPNEVEMRQALELLKLIFDTKGVSVEEQKQRFKSILEYSESEALFPEYESLKEE